MRSFVTLFVTVVMVSLFVQCDEKKDVTCDDALAAYDAAFIEVCTDLDDCVPCECWVAGQTTDGSECGAPVTCDASELMACDADPVQCAVDIITMIETACGTEL